MDDFETVAAQVRLLLEQNELLQRDMYELMRTSNALKDSSDMLGALVVELSKLVKQTHPEYNFGFGGVLPPDLM